MRIRDLELHGNESLPDRRAFLLFRRGLKKLAEVKLRSPYLFGLFPRSFDPEELDADIVALREVYRDQGFLDAVVELERLEFDEDRRWVTIHLAIDEGTPYVVGSVAIQAVLVGSLAGVAAGVFGVWMAGRSSWARSR